MWFGPWKCWTSPVKVFLTDRTVHATGSSPFVRVRVEQSATPQTPPKKGSVEEDQMFRQKVLDHVRHSTAVPGHGGVGGAALW